MPAAQAAAVQLFAMPTAVMQAGKVYGPQVSAAVGAAFTKWQVNIQKMGTWPNGDCLQVLIEYSQDGGQTWRIDAQATFAGGAWKDRTGAAITLGSLSASMGVLKPGSVDQVIVATAAADLFRVTVNCLQNCSALITMGAIP